jgi:anti-anti-sigma factor
MALLPRIPEIPDAVGDPGPDDFLTDSSSSPARARQTVPVTDPRSDDDFEDLASISRSAGQDGSIVLAVRGELDVSSAADVRPEVTAAVAESPARIVFDLSELRFMDSSGLAILLVAAKSVPVRLRNPTPAIVRLVELTGLSGVLPIEEDAPPAADAG